MSLHCVCGTAWQNTRRACCRCRLSKRQRTLYEDYMASSDTNATLASSNFLGIINVLMQLRKVPPGINMSLHDNHDITAMT